MFEFMEMLSFGQRFEAHGELWVLIKYLQRNYCLAIKEGSPLLATIYLVQRPDPIQKEKP